MGAAAAASLAEGLSQATSPPGPFQYHTERVLDQCALQPGGRPASAFSLPALVACACTSTPPTRMGATSRAGADAAMARLRVLARCIAAASCGDAPRPGGGAAAVKRAAGDAADHCAFDESGELLVKPPPPSAASLPTRMPSEPPKRRLPASPACPATFVANDRRYRSRRWKIKTAAAMAEIAAMPPTAPAIAAIGVATLATAASAPAVLGEAEGETLADAPNERLAVPDAVALLAVSIELGDGSNGDSDGCKLPLLGDEDVVAADVVVGADDGDAPSDKLAVAVELGVAPTESEAVAVVVPVTV